MTATQFTIKWATLTALLPPSLSAVGGFLYWVTIFPVDCIKSAMQTDNILRSQRKYTDLVTTAKVSRHGQQAQPSRGVVTGSRHNRQGG